MSDDELKLPPPATPRVDSLAAIGQAVQSSSRAKQAIPYLLSVLTLVGGWLAAKVDTKLDIQHEVRVQVAQWQVAQAELQAERHAQVLREFSRLELQLLSQDVNNLGKVPQVEKGMRVAFRVLAQLHAMTLAGETAKVRAAKETAATKFGIGYDTRADGRAPQVVFAEVIDRVAVP